MTLAALASAVRKQVTWLYTPRINRVIGGIVFDSALGVIGSLKTLSTAGKVICNIVAGDVPFCSTEHTRMDMTDTSRECPDVDTEAFDVQSESSDEDTDGDTIGGTPGTADGPTKRSLSMLIPESDPTE